MLPAAIAKDETTAITLLVIATTCYGAYTANLWAVTQTLAGPVAAGKWTGMQNGIGNFAGVVCPALTGYLADRTGSFIWPFAIVAAVLVAGAFSFGVIVRRVEPVKWRSHTAPVTATSATTRL
jgi:cyanate permease